MVHSDDILDCGCRKQLGTTERGYPIKSLLKKAVLKATLKAHEHKAKDAAEDTFCETFNNR